MTTWDVRDEQGELVSDVKSLAEVLGSSEADAAAHLLDNEQLVQVAPYGLVTEAKGFVPFKKKGDKDEADTGSSTRKVTISSGAYVTWSGGRGRVEMVVDSGQKVPKVDTDITGTKDKPAARVRVWKEKDGKWAQTDERVGVYTSSLKTSPPFGGPSKKAHPEEELVTKLADFAGERKPTPTAVKAVYNRGIKAHPGQTVTSLSAEEWGLERVNAFLAKAEGVEVANYTRDDDLLP